MDPVRRMQLVLDDVQADAKKPVEFTPLGIGTVYGELLSMIGAVARTAKDHLEVAHDHGDAEQTAAHLLRTAPGRQGELQAVVGVGWAILALVDEVRKLREVVTR
jgi:hypothetical protein